LIAEKRDQVIAIKKRNPNKKNERCSQIKVRKNKSHKIDDSSHSTKVMISPKHQTPKNQKTLSFGEGLCGAGGIRTHVQARAH